MDTENLINLLRTKKGGYMDNFERIKNMTREELAAEIKLIANWDRKEKRKAEKDDEFYLKWLNSKCK